MIDTKELRRLVQAALAAPDGLSAEWMDRLGQFQEAADASVVSELLDRLEEAESDALEQARLNGIGASREAALMAKLEAAEKERDALLARIEAMEKQEPVAWCATDETGTVIEALGMNQSRRFDTALYLAPGAQPAPIEQDTSVRKAWARFSNELHRSPDAPYPGMSEAFEQHFSQSFTDREWRAESATWAAAWKAAKRHEAQAQPAPSFADAYQGAMEEVAIWKKRALEAEDMNRKFIAEINGPTHMGEPAQPAPSIPEGIQRVARDFYWDNTALHYVPFVRVEFQPVASNSSDDAKGWQDRDRFFAAMLAAASEYKP